ncbi:retrovirus-related pol polyprotein from transposon TNT 1-94 [Tanacetum coccineum]
MSTSNKQTIADSGANERPPMLEKGNYIPWESRFRRFLDNKLEDGKRIHVIHSRLMDEFDKFAAKEGESLESMYERLTTLVNIMDLQFEPHVLASIAKKAANNHDVLALLVQSNSSSSQSHANSSYSLQPYYITNPSSDKFSTPTNNRLPTSSNTRNQVVVQDGRIDIQTKNICYGENGNRNLGRQNRNRAFKAGNGNDNNIQIVQRVPRTESTLGKANVLCYNCNEIGHYAGDCPKPRVRDAKYFREQMLPAMKDEAGSILKDE